jgi:hypothetical protein
VTDLFFPSSHGPAFPGLPSFRKASLTASKTSHGGFASFKALTSLLLLPALLSGCALVTTRPIQEMSDTVAALKAAREVQADKLAPELFRQANEWFFKAKGEYKMKNFALAQDFARKARIFAEQAEFEVLRTGVSRIEVAPSDPLAAGGPAPPPPPPDAPPPPKPEPYAYPEPKATPVEAFMKPENSGGTGTTNSGGSTPTITPPTP